MNNVYILHPNTRARENAVNAVKTADDGSRVLIGPPPKSRSQENLYHAMIEDIAAQMTIHGLRWEDEDMKRLLLDQFHRDTLKDDELRKEWEKIGGGKIVPSIDGSGVVQLGVQSRKFSKRLASAFVEWLYAFGAEQGVTWTEPRGASR